MTGADRETLRYQFNFCCGYCGVRESDAGSQLTVDHFQPASRGGNDTPENWVYCCHACNEFKGDHWAPDSQLRVLHPVRDGVEAHVADEPDGVLRPLTETGGFHVERLRLNRPQLVENRRRRRHADAARQAEERLLERMLELDRRLKQALADLAALKEDARD